MEFRLVSPLVPVPREVHLVPGDKSITHRALLFAALGLGRSAIHQPLVSLDTRSTARVLRQLGTPISPLRHGATIEVRGGGFRPVSGQLLNCGNSGTTARLLMGMLAGRPVAARLTGDRSLRSRPMRRITEPLKRMGAQFQDDPATLPISMIGGGLVSLEWQSPVASAQIKGALLLAGVTGGVAVSVSEPVRSRDHTERILASFGYTIVADHLRVHMEPSGRVVPFELTVPGDPSSAAFLIGAALLGRHGTVRIARVGLNPTRTGFLRVLTRMGAQVSHEDVSEMAGEPSGTLVATAGPLRATTVEASEVPSLIDEVPILACLAARAQGESRFAGLAELRVKESDRLSLIAENLRAIGVSASVSGDDLSVVGTDAPLAGRVRTGGDHRIAMAFAVLGLGQAVHVDDPECADVSFPGFASALNAIAREVA